MPDRLGEADFGREALREANKIFNMALSDEAWRHAFINLLTWSCFTYVACNDGRVAALPADKDETWLTMSVPCACLRRPARIWLVDERLPRTLLWLPTLARRLGAPLATLMAVGPSTLPRAAAAGARTMDEVLVAQL